MYNAKVSKYNKCKFRLNVNLHIFLQLFSTWRLCTKNAWFYAIGVSTIHQIIPEVCEVLCELMAPICLAFLSAEEFSIISNGFQNDLHFPNCIGALDGRHCPIRKPINRTLVIVVRYFI